MAEWQYDAACECLLEYEGDEQAVMIADEVGPRHGPLMAMAPRMEAVLRTIKAVAENEGDMGADDCPCPTCEACRLIAELDASREATPDGGPAA